MDAFDSELRGRLVHLLSAAPGHSGALPSTDARIAARDVGPVRRIGRPVSSAPGLVGAVIIAVIIGAAAWLLVLRPAPAGTLIPGAAVGDGSDSGIVWDSGLVRLEADAIRIETPNGTFRAIDVEPFPDPRRAKAAARRSPKPGRPREARSGAKEVDFLIHSDPGDDRYRTLEVTWYEAGVEMRMNIYLAADEREWWATEMRVYDGSTDGDWIGWGGRWGQEAADGRPVAERGELPQAQSRRFGVPADAEIISAAGDGRGLTSVLYRDDRGRVHSIRCEGAAEIQPAGVTLDSSVIARAELCPPPPIDLGLFRTPLGETWTGDLDLVDGTVQAGDGLVGELHIEGMRLSAF